MTIRPNTIRQAIITFDSKRARKWDYQAEGQSITWILKEALNERDYPRERGIISIDVLGIDQSVFIGPADNIDGETVVYAK